MTIMIIEFDNKYRDILIKSTDIFSIVQDYSRHIDFKNANVYIDDVLWEIIADSIWLPLHGSIRNKYYDNRIQ